MNTEDKRCKVGELRPSQILTTYGVGSIIDLPHLSVMVMGLDDWPLKDTVKIGEQRLLASVREVMGGQVQALRSAPVVPDSLDDPFGTFNLIGIPVAPFPRWMVCPYCHRLAPLSSGLFRLEKPYRADQIRFVHANCKKPGKPPTVVPARFIVACKNGHLDDFPWRAFVHRGKTECKGGLKLNELGASGEAAEVQVECDGCGVTRRMSDAFKLDTDAMPECGGRRPHLRDYEEGGCKGLDGQGVKSVAMLQGASNAWFALSLSALALPEGTNELTQLIAEHWNILEKTQSQRRSTAVELRDSFPQPFWLILKAI